jgi:hypothetical protein
MNRVCVLANSYFTAPASYQTGILLIPVTRSICNKVLEYEKMTKSKFTGRSFLDKKCGVLII